MFTAYTGRFHFVYSLNPVIGFRTRFGRNPYRWTWYISVVGYPYKITAKERIATNEDTIRIFKWPRTFSRMNIESLLFIREKMSIHLLDLDYVSPRRKIEVVGMEKRMVEEDMLWLQSTILLGPLTMTNASIHNNTGVAIHTVLSFRTFLS